VSNTELAVAGGWAEEALTGLASMGYRNAGARRVVIELLPREGGCLDAQAVFDRLREQGQRVGTATVYRTLDLLAEQGFAQRVDLGSEAACYVPVLPGCRHHHLVCTSRGRVEVFASCTVDDALAEAEKQSGYTVSVRDIVLRGICRDCREADVNRNAAR
jgi:Fur family transcriptional regulator, ferric uptake regulator